MNHHSQSRKPPSYSATPELLQLLNMKREPRITLPIKKPAKVDKLEPQWRLWIWYFLMTLLVLWVWQELANQVQYQTISYSEFKTYLAQRAVVEAVVKQNEIDGRIVPKQDQETKSKPAENTDTQPLPGSNPNAFESLSFFGPNGSRIPGL